jgi:hypothetical protein
METMAIHESVDITDARNAPARHTSRMGFF